MRRGSALEIKTTIGHSDLTFDKDAFAGRSHYHSSPSLA